MWLTSLIVVVSFAKVAVALDDEIIDVFESSDVRKVVWDLLLCCFGVCILVLIEVVSFSKDVVALVDEIIVCSVVSEAGCDFTMVVSPTVVESTAVCL